MKFVERDDVLEMLALGWVSGEHSLLLGPPGTAKTALVQEFAKAVAVPVFHRLLTQFTTPDEILGPVDINALKAGRVERVVDGFLPTAEVVFLDEVFKASSAILNTLLDAMEYRRLLISPSQQLQLPLRMLVGASNEYPQGGLEAFADRFGLRMYVGYVSQGSFLQLLQGQGTTVVPPPIPSTIADPSPVFPLMLQLRQELDGRISDRRWVKLAKLVGWHAAMQGKPAADPSDLLVARFVLWEPETGQEGYLKLEARLYDLAMPEIAQARAMVREIEEAYAQAKTFAEKLQVAARIQTAVKAMERMGRDRVNGYIEQALTIYNALLEEVKPGAGS